MDNLHAIPPKADPEQLALRAAPRKVMRLRRSLMVGISAVASVALFAMVAYALQSPTRDRATGKELYSVDRKATADGLAALPVSYGDVKNPETPVLGPPLPGDLGGPILVQERALGVEATASEAGGFHATPEANDARAEALRIAQQARRAKEASVFFPLSQNRSMVKQGRPDEGVSSGAPEPQIALNLETDQNNQQRKIDFMGRPGAQSVYNAYPLQDAVSPFQVMAGSVIAASLITGINSDLPGLVVAQVTENIYDTVSGRFLLIPQGSKLIGSYDSVIAFGQTRALLVWQRIVMPDGSSIQIENVPATDASGYAGLADKVDFHTWRLLKGVVLSTLLGVGTELSLGSEESDLLRAIRESTQQNVNRAGQRITEKNLNLQPTIRIRQGWPLRIVVNKDLILRPYRG